MVEVRLGSIFLGLASPWGRIGTEWHFDMSLQLGEKTILVPDIAFVKRERLHGLSATFLQIPNFAPDVAVEIRSPSDRAGEREWKIGRYLAAGSTLVLDVSPSNRTIAAYDAVGAPRLYRNGERFAHDAVPWLTFEVAEAFTDLDIDR